MPTGFEAGAAESHHKMSKTSDTQRPLAGQQTEQHSTRADAPQPSSGTGRKRRRRAARPLTKDLWPDRHFWGLVLQPKRGDAAEQAGKEQLVSREYHLHITHATLLVDEDARPREAAAARTQLWIANCNHGEVGKAENRAPRLVCSLSANGRESQKLNVRLSGQRVRLIAVGQGCTIHLSGCLEQEEQEEENDSDDLWDDASSADSDSEIESGSASGSDTVPDKVSGRQSGSQLSAMLASLDDSDSDDEDFTVNG